MKNLLIVLFALAAMGAGYAQPQEFPISTWFGINSLSERETGWQTHWNNQKQKNFKNLEAAGFNTTHAISSRYGSGYPVFDSLLTLAISQEILDSAAVHGLQVELQHYFNIEPASHFQRIQVEVEEELKLPPGVNYEDINEVAFVISEGVPFIESDIQGKQLIPGTHISGIVFQDARPVNKYTTFKYPKVLNVNPHAYYPSYPNLFSNHYYLRCRLKIDPTGHPPTEPVITLRMVQVDPPHTVYTEHTFLVQDFASQEYETKDIEADIPDDGNYPEVEESPRGTLDDPKRYVYDVDFEVEWHGSVRIWVDWIAMDDEGAHKLFDGDYDSKIKNTAKTLNAHPALFNFYLFDEPYLKHLVTFNQVNRLLRDAAIENGIDPSGGKGLAQTAFVGATRGKQYYITNRLADPWAYYVGSDAYPYRVNANWLFVLQSNGFYNAQLQDRINVILNQYLEGVRTAKSDNDKLSWFFTQVGGNGIDPNNELRIPYNSEIWLNVNLALAVGAKGISYFLYPTNPGGTTDLTGLVKYRYDPNPYDPITTNPYTQNPWENITDLNSYLKTIGPTLLSLDRIDTFTGTTIPAGNGVLSAINNAAYPEYIQISLFTHQETQEDYLSLLNRMCREPTPADPTIPDDTQSFDVELVNSSSLRVIEDIYASRTPNNTNAFATLNANENSFALTLKPGMAKLLRITGGLHGIIPANPYTSPAKSISTVT